MEKNRYVPQSILLTGAAGFVASHLATRLCPTYKVVALDRLDQSSSLANLSSCWSSPNFKFIQADASNFDFVQQILHSEAIDTVLHFAATTHVGKSFGASNLHFTTNNVGSTHSLLQACVLYGKVKRFIFISTDEVYGETEVSSHSESSMLSPPNPYAASKAGGEMHVMAYGTSFKLPYILLRVNNMYGPNQFPDKLVPKFIMLAMQRKSIPIHGDGSSKRALLYIDDAVRAFEVVLLRGTCGEIYNIGTTEEKRVIDVAKDICMHLDVDQTKLLRYEKDRPFNGKGFLLNSEKLQKLGWSVKVSWEQGLKNTVNWFHQNPTWWGQLELSGDDMNMIPRVRLLGKKMKFLVYGRNGWIGRLVGEICVKQGIEFDFGNARLENMHEIDVDMQRFQPTHVISAAGVTGYPNVDWCEDNKLETLRANVYGAINLADACKKRNMLVVQFGSGCVYEYDESHPVGSGIGFKEDDVPNCNCSFFSRTKIWAQELLKPYDNVCWLRIRLPVSSNLGHPKNLIYKLQRYDKLVNIPNSVTVLDELLPVAVTMARQKMTGIWNFTNPGSISHNELLQLYKEYVNGSINWTNFSVEEQAKVLKSPRCHNELDSTKLLAAFPSVLPVRHSLLKYVFQPNRSQGLLKSSL